MSKEKQIEEMANDYYEAMLKASNTIGSMNYGAPKWYAKELYNAGYRKQSEWISVDERLPNKYGKYLTYGKPNYSSYVDILYYNPNRSVWYLFDNEWGDCEVDDVTHWMPLPKAPKGGE